MSSSMHLAYTGYIFLASTGTCGMSPVPQQWAGMAPWTRTAPRTGSRRCSRRRLLRKLGHALGVLSQERRPHVIAQRNVGQLAENAVVGETGGEVTGPDDFVGAARVREVDDVLRVVLRRERGRR